jgi:hypothetical protein
MKFYHLQNKSRQLIKIWFGIVQMAATRTKLTPKNHDATPATSEADRIILAGSLASFLTASLRIKVTGSNHARPHREQGNH